VLERQGSPGAGLARLLVGWLDTRMPGSGKPGYGQSWIRKQSGGGYGEKFQALLATIELPAPGGVCQPIKYILSGFARRTGSFGPIGRSTIRNYSPDLFS
jgi:hypothetical protein